MTGAKGDALELIRSLKEQYPDETEDQLISRFPRARQACGGAALPRREEARQKEGGTVG